MNDYQNSAYLGVFLDEMDEQLQCMDESLLALECDGCKDQTIQKIFRAAHTLKGSSAVMGFERLNKLTHQMESVLDLLRNGQLDVSSDLLNILFDCIDYIKQLRQSILGGAMAEGDISALSDRLTGVREAGGILPVQSGIAEPKAASPLQVAFDSGQKALIQSALGAGFAVMAIHVHLSEQESMKYVRAKLVELNLLEHGELVVCHPDLGTIEQDEHFSGTIMYVLVSRQSPQDILRSLNQVSQIHSVHIEYITGQNLNGFEAEKEVKAPAAKTAEKEAEPKASAEGKVQVSQTVRVDVDRLENLLNLVGELIIGNTRLSSIRTKLNDQFKDNADIHLLNDIAHHLSNVVGDLQEGMMKTRMLPMEHLFGRFPRMVRDLAQKAGKEIELIIEGKETELDRTLIEEISDPLIHILRNSADHGLEAPEERIQKGKTFKGTIVLRASHQGNRIVITIADDGRGIDIDKVKEAAVRKGFVTEEEVAGMSDKELTGLIFRSGVSTAKQVTDLSGRGVGMDIVKSHIEKLNGEIDIETTRGEGTVFTIKVPLTLAIIRALLVKLGAGTFAVPLVNVNEIFKLKAAEIRVVQGKEVCLFRDQILPLIRLHGKLNVPSYKEQDRMFVVIVGQGDKRVCLVVDQTIGNQEIVIKSLGNYIGSVPYLAGSTILGDGHVAHILDVGSIVRDFGSYQEKQLLGIMEEAKLRSREEKYVTFQLGGMDFGIPIRKMKEIVPVPDIHPLVFESPHVMGMMNLRGTLLPVYDLRGNLGMDYAELSSGSRIMICEVSGHEVGLLVDKVTKVKSLSQSDLEEAPGHVLRNLEFLDAIYKKEPQLILLLNLEKMMNLEHFQKKEVG